MALAKSKLITKVMPWSANMTEANHLGRALITKPYVFEGVMNQLFTAHRYSDNPLTAMLSAAVNGEQEISGTEWEWQLRTATTKPLVSKGNTNDPSVTQPCVGKTVALLYLNDNWFKPGDIISPGTTNKKFQARVQEDPYRLGNGFVYKIRLMSDDFAAFIPLQYFTTGTQWAKLYSQYEEGGDQSGSTMFSMPITLKNRMSRYRKMYSVTGDVQNQVLAVKIPDSNGAMHDSWIKYAEVEYWQQWYRELERGKWYSRQVDSVTGSTGRSLYTGPGVQQQLEDSHIHYYTDLTTDLIEQYLMDIFYSRVAPGAKRKIKAFTGEYGMIIFHKAIMDWQEKRGFVQVVTDEFIQKASSPYTENGLSAGYQYVKYRMANGAELELIHNPLYDDREINMEIDPITGYPVESMRFTFLDFSGDSLTGNMRKMKRKGSMKLGYVAGMTNPYGPSNDGLMSHAGDHYDMHVAYECGIHIEDISRCGELILRRN